MREGPLHAAIKELLAERGDRVEVPVGRFVIDLVRVDGELVEVQTGAFGPLGAKLDALLDEHRIRIVHPIAARRRIVRVDEHAEVLSIRSSPRRGAAIDVFDKLVAFPSLLTHPNLTIELLLLSEDHIRAAQPATVRGRRRDPGERRLRDVLGRLELHGAGDVLRLLPPLPREPFSTRELAGLLGCRPLLAQRTAYCLRAMGIIEAAGKRGPTPLHRLVELTTRVILPRQKADTPLGAAGLTTRRINAIPAAGPLGPANLDLDARHDDVRWRRAVQRVGATDVAGARRQIDIALAAGVNLIDTADIYSSGGRRRSSVRHSEIVAIRSCWRPRRASRWATGPTTQASRAST